jgi:hypothetical protein
VKDRSRGPELSGGEVPFQRVDRRRIFTGAANPLTSVLWTTPAGSVELKILDIVYQPEANGDIDL